MTPEQYVQDKAAHSGSSFYYAFMFLPPPKRAAITAFYAFCREIDDAVDDTIDRGVAATKLAWWRQEVAAAFAGQPTHPATKALMPHTQAHCITATHLSAVIDGCQMDLDQTRYLDFAGLQRYCHLVAGVVGEVAATIFGRSSEQTVHYAHKLGQALQLTNIIRDVSTDLKRGRIYLPMDDLAWFHVTEHDLRAGSMTPNVKSLMRYQCRRARYYYRLASERLPRIDRRSLVAAEIMGEIYFAILRKIERARYDVFTRRIRVGRPRRAIIALDIWSRALLEPRPRGRR